MLFVGLPLWSNAASANLTASFRLCMRFVHIRTSYTLAAGRVGLNLTTLPYVGLFVLAGVAGFGPTNAGVKVPCLNHLATPH